MILLNEKLREQLTEETETYEKENTMPFITSMEQSGIDKGKAEVARRMIAAEMSDEEIQKFTQLPLKKIAELRKEKSEEE